MMSIASVRVLRNCPVTRFVFSQRAISNWTVNVQQTSEFFVTKTSHFNSQIFEAFLPLVCAKSFDKFCNSSFNYNFKQLINLSNFFERFRGSKVVREKSRMETLAQLENNSEVADSLINEIYSALALLQKSDPQLGAEVKNLVEQNNGLKQEIREMKEKVVLQQIRNGGNPNVRDPRLIERSAVVASSGQGAPSKPAEAAPVEEKKEPAAPNAQKPDKKGKKDGGAKPADGGQKGKPKAGAPAPAADASEVIDIGRLDLRVGLIKECTRHPDADSLYVEKIDVGEENVRTVISGLVKHVPIEQMQNRLVIALCNLKPSKMRGITSEAMVMCASTPEKVEILIPPAGSMPGDLIEVEGYTRRPDAVMNPKKKIFETVAPDLKTDNNKTATYRGIPWNVPGKGAVVAESLINVNIK